MPVKAKCHKIQSDKSLQRSSQTISIVSGQAYIFGGELLPREPVDNNMYVVSGDGKLSSKY